LNTEVGNGGLTDDEAISHFSLWAALKSPLLMTNVLNKIDGPTISILQNTAVLAVSQDPTGSSAVRMWRHYVDDGEIQLYSGPLSGGDQIVLLLNCGSIARDMNATLVDIFWANGAKGTASQVRSAWDIYDLWGGRMSNITAQGIIQGGENATWPIDMSNLGGASKVYSQVPLPASKALMGTKVGSVKASGTVKARVRPHGVAMLRLRAQKSNDEL
jgi:alpha-galactosidase